MKLKVKTKESENLNQKITIEIIAQKVLIDKFHALNGIFYFLAVKFRWIDENSSSQTNFESHQATSDL